MAVIIAVLTLLGLVAVYFALGARIVKQYERGLVFRLGRVLEQTRGPGLTFVRPGIERLRKVNVQIITLPVPAQDCITRDNVTVRVDAVVYFKVVDPVLAIVNVQDYRFAMLQVAQTSLRSMIGKSDLDDLLSNRERLNQGLEVMIDSPALDWGIHIDRVEIKDVALPESMKRSMYAAATMAETPAALQLRLLETVVEVAAEKNSTLVLPFPVELLRFLERAPSAQTTTERINLATDRVDNGSSQPPPLR